MYALCTTTIRTKCQAYSINILYTCHANNFIPRCMCCCVRPLKLIVIFSHELRASWTANCIWYSETIHKAYGFDRQYHRHPSRRGWVDCPLSRAHRPICNYLNWQSCNTFKASTLAISLSITILNHIWSRIVVVKRCIVYICLAGLFPAISIPLTFHFVAVRIEEAKKLPALLHFLIFHIKRY